MEDNVMELLAKATADSWAVTVRFAACYPSERDIVEMAETCSVGPAGMRQKVRAIQLAIDRHIQIKRIVDMGQFACLSAAAVERNARRGPARWLLSVVPTGLHAAVQATLERIRAAIGANTSEEVWEFINSVFADMDDNEIRQLAGEPKK